MISAYGNHRVLINGLIASFILLAIFGLSEFCDNRFLNLEPKWMIISFTPLIIAIIVSGYIKSFKGFGIEIETRFGEPLDSYTIDIMGDVIVQMVSEKSSFNFLYSIGQEKREHIKVLSFVNKKRGYYSESHIQQYLKILLNIEYFLIINSRGNYIYTLNAKYFRNLDDENGIKLLIQSIEDGKLIDVLAPHLIQTVLIGSTKIIDALDQLHKRNTAFAVVISTSNKFIGLVSRASLEDRIVKDAITIFRLK